ncbi:hypothetical protein Bind_1060 [Beijerinckia indica subsp. indica ATCC 9039]|uniref:Uncharacterized protein n=1 Tax=Beijerinckia indica subsp. indica (strain ATCC 9039 / DSM 1715 / NCIMB 8712) TaxID=395963 RepID=B2IIL0_BEII9|nr:hypothetical protein Bind_1060 [Beijerinckia indica subsp. indica ATCC 9039]
MFFKAFRPLARFPIKTKTISTNYGKGMAEAGLGHSLEHDFFKNRLPAICRNFLKTLKTYPKSGNTFWFDTLKNEYPIYFCLPSR